MRSAILLVSIAAFPLCLSAAEPAASSAEKPALAVVDISGDLICTHCDLGIGNDCCSGLKADKTVVILAGKANEKLFDLRFGGGKRRVRGTVGVKDGNLHLFGDAVDGKSEKGSVTVTGQVVAAETNGKKQTSLANGKEPIVLTGEKAASLAESAGKWAELTGALAVNREGKVAIEVATVKLLDAPPSVAGSLRERAPAVTTGK
jgi:hypothetical protein